MGKGGAQEMGGGLCLWERKCIQASLIHSCSERNDSQLRQDATDKLHRQSQKKSENQILQRSGKRHLSGDLDFIYPAETSLPAASIKVTTL